MGEKKEILAVVIAFIIALSAVLLLYWGAITLLEFGGAIAGLIVTAFFGVLYWGFKGRINRWLDNRKKIDDNKDELENLIKPLYLEFDKYSEANSKRGVYKGLPLRHCLIEDPNFDNLKDLVGVGAEKAESTIKIMEEQGYRTQSPRLRELMGQFIKFKQMQKEGNYDYLLGSEDMRNKVIPEIEDLVRKRYMELAWGDKEN